jgi:hypothetical protein
MSEDRYDQLLQIRQHAAHQRLVQGLESQRQANWQDYCQALTENNVDQAAFAESEYLRHTRELAEMTGQQQQLQASQQQPQQQYTQAEQDLMRDYPDEIRRNWNTALAASRNLVASKLQADPEADQWAYRNSAEYIRGIALACGVLNSDGTESLEVKTPNEALRICQSKYGPTTVEEYNSGVARLIEDKRAGKYPMSQT